MKYKCAKCGKIVDRDSDKKWIPSYCSEKDVKTRIYKYERTKKF